MRIGALIERVKEAAANPQNQSRGQRRPNINFGIEEPMTWVLLWQLDTPRYYSDPPFYVETTLNRTVLSLATIIFSCPGCSVCGLM